MMNTYVISQICDEILIMVINMSTPTLLINTLSNFYPTNLNHLYQTAVENDP